MADKSKIEWTDASWTPIRARVKANAADIALAKGYTTLVQIAGEMARRVGPHCEHVSPGCENCYSETNNGRCLPVNGTGLPFDRRSRDLVDVFLDERILVQPLRWRRQKWIFVCSQTDLFGEFVTDEMIDSVFAVMALSPWHKFQVLTKRAERMREYFTDLSDRQEGLATQAERICGVLQGGEAQAICASLDRLGPRWPLPLAHVMLGVSVEDRNRLRRIDQLFETPAAVRFASLEPLLEDLGDIRDALIRHCSGCGQESKPGSGRCLTPGCDGRARRGLDWVIVGGESGRGARQCDPQWVRSIRDQCVKAAVPFFFKQWGAWMPIEGRPCLSRRGPGQRIGGEMVCVGKKAAGRLLDGRTWDEMPEMSTPSDVWGEYNESRSSR